MAVCVTPTSVAVAPKSEGNPCLWNQRSEQEAVLTEKHQDFISILRANPRKGSLPLRYVRFSVISWSSSHVPETN
jgi:hypothetical protein